MEKKEIVTSYVVYADRAELPEADRALAEAAAAATDSAHAPYSGYRVGAAARLADGRLVTASNQESEVFPSGMCAERILLYRVQSEFPGTAIEAVAVTAARNGEPAEEEVYPCGACAQVFADTEKRQRSPLRVIMAGRRSCSVVESAGSLLPFRFEYTKQ